MWKLNWIHLPQRSLRKFKKFLKPPRKSSRKVYSLASQVILPNFPVKTTKLRYCWCKTSCTSWNPIIYRVLYIPGGAGVLPLTVCFIQVLLNLLPFSTPQNPCGLSSRFKLWPGNVLQTFAKPVISGRKLTTVTSKAMTHLYIHLIPQGCYACEIYPHPESGRPLPKIRWIHGRKILCPGLDRGNPGKNIVIYLY